MSIFSRRPSNPSPGPSIQEAVRPPEPELSFGDEIRKRLQTKEKAHEEFLLDALKRGVPEADLSRLAADALSARAIPSVFHFGDRGGNITFYLVDGIVPASLLNVDVRHGAHDGKTYASLRGPFQEHEATPEEPFRIRATEQFNMLDRRPLPADPAAELTLIDSYLATQVPDPNTTPQS